MVPDHCVIDIDRRTLPGESREEVLAELHAVIETVKTELPELKANLEVAFWADASETPEGTRMVDLLDAARTALDVEGYELGYSGATDGRYLINDAGIPAIVFGPGDLKVAHTTGEFVEVDELVAGARIYAHAFAGFFDA
jgi:acetylornithine deacetylase/succinyl-diaminopimelate desuccinylase